MNRWNGRVALVTGASMGIGAGICRGLIKHGMSVVGCSRGVEWLQQLARDAEISKGPGEFHAIGCDVTKEKDILSMFREIRRRFGRIDVCINNVGTTLHSPLAYGGTNEWVDMLKLNVLGLSICTRESLALMKEKDIKDGQIIHLGSIFGHRIPIGVRTLDLPCFGAYYGTKFMVRALAEALRQELKETNSKIRVATITPSSVQTETMTASFGPDFFKDTVCLKPKDISEVVTYILSTPPHVNVEDVTVQSIDFSL